mgnify:CR=1 FL=1
MKNKNKNETGYEKRTFNAIRWTEDERRKVMQARIEAAMREASEMGLETLEDFAGPLAGPPLSVNAEAIKRDDARRREEFRKSMVHDSSISKPTPRAPELIEKALAALSGNAKLRDCPDGERSAARAAAIFSAWTGSQLSVSDVWRVLLCVKLAREIQGQFNADDYTDIAGYAGLLGEEMAG